MKSSLQQSTLVAMQRLAGAIIGATVAAVFLLAVENKIVLEVASSSSASAAQEGFARRAALADRLEEDRYAF